MLPPLFITGTDTGIGKIHAACVLLHALRARGLRAVRDEAGSQRLYAYPGRVMVVGLRLGCLNHARLTARAIFADGRHLHGWIGNQIAPDFRLMDAYLDLLHAALPAPCLGVLPYWPQANTADAANAVHFSLVI